LTKTANLNFFEENDCFLCCSDDDAFELQFDVEIERRDAVNGSTLYDEDEDNRRPPIISLPGSYVRFKC
jgi:hypothetical protein